jgi:hypothetical protein
LFVVVVSLQAQNYKKEKGKRHGLPCLGYRQTGHVERRELEAGVEEEEEVTTLLSLQSTEARRLFTEPWQGSPKVASLANTRHECWNRHSRSTT